MPKSELPPLPLEAIPSPPPKPRPRKPAKDTTHAAIKIVVEPPASAPIPLSKLRCYAKFSRRPRRFVINTGIAAIPDIQVKSGDHPAQPQAVSLPIIAPIPSAIELPECNMEIKRIVEAILFAANRPMTIKQIQQVFPEIEQPDTLDIQSAIEAIIEEHQSRPVELKKLASGYRFQVRVELSRWVSRLFEEKPPKYSRALLETLSIIAYRQPVTRGEIEDIRGVSVSSSIIQTLLEREWIRVVAHKEVPGRPGLYGTTKQFLDYFNIESLNELPTLHEIQHLDLAADSNPNHIQVDSEQQQTRQQAAESEEASATTEEPV
ncbi:MAG: SMC-Scp complex subunit ScpB [Methylococcales bacterium]